MQSYRNVEGIDFNVPPRAASRLSGESLFQLEPNNLTNQLVSNLRNYSQGMTNIMSPNPDSWIICGGATEIVFALATQDLGSDSRLGLCSLQTKVSVIPSSKISSDNFKELNRIVESALINAVFVDKILVSDAIRQIDTADIFDLNKPMLKSALGEMSKTLAEQTLLQRGVSTAVFNFLFNSLESNLKSGILDRNILSEFTGPFNHSCAMIRVEGSDSTIFADFSSRQFDRYLPIDRRQKFPLVVERLPVSSFNQHLSDIDFMPQADSNSKEYVLGYRIQNRGFHFQKPGEVWPTFKTITDKIRSSIS